jgi:transglutaminase-like putative cysteine protease
MTLVPAGSSPGPNAARTVRFTYSVSIRDIPERAAELSIWLPVPKSNGRQDVLELAVDAPLEYSFTRETRHDNRLLHLSARAPLPDTVELRVHARITRRGYTVLGAGARQEGDPPTARDLAPDSLVPVDGAIAAAARQATRDARTPRERARAIYDYVTSSMRYDRSGVGWGQGDAVYACDARRGNCTDFHSLIIGMARAVGIPARFVMGFSLPEDRAEGEIDGYHCWAELWVDGIGWLPLDSSEASKHPEKREALFGGLDANRVEFTRGRDLVLVPPACRSLNFLIYPHVEVDGVVHPAVEQTFTFVDTAAGFSCAASHGQRIVSWESAGLLHVLVGAREASLVEAAAACRSLLSG